MLEDERLRFLVAGAWNSLFGWLAFAGLLYLLAPEFNLWLISAVAHLVATSQAFVVQRFLVFRKTLDPVWPQFVKFQVVYLIMLCIGALMVNGLSAQGLDPRLAQFLAMVLLAVCGFVLGKSFTFNPNAIDFGASLGRIRIALREIRVPLAGLAVSLVFFELIWGRFYSNPTAIGHDFALTGIGLLEGKYWLMSNGVIGGLFNPPWFTPAWCAGAAFYADPQSAFYSPLQWLSLWIDPFLATHLNALLFATAGYIGSYLLARNIFKWTTAGATVFAVVGIANNFLPLRSAVGEAGYQPWPLWPWLVLALCWPNRGNWRGNIWPGIAVCALLTAWLQFGFAGMLVPAVLAALLLCCLLVINSKARALLVGSRLVLGAMLALVLNGSKIYESMSLMEQFPRDFYELPGLSSLGDVLATITLSLFAPSEWAFSYARPILINMRFTALPHEWALGFGFGSLIVAGVGVVAIFLARRGITDACGDPQSAARLPSWERWLAISGAVVLIALPILLLWNVGLIRDLIKQIPILNSASWPMRWIILYLPAIQWLLASPVQHLSLRFPASRNLITGAVIALIWIGPSREPLDYYVDRQIQNYNPSYVLGAYEAARSERTPIAITHISGDPKAAGFGNRNDSMIGGISQGFCYNPIYGYRLEAFPNIARLRDGEALSADSSGQSLLFNPACLVHPTTNACAPGDGFQMSDSFQRTQAEQFLSRHPFAWRRPLLGQCLALLSQVTFWILLALIGLRLWNLLLKSVGRDLNPDEALGK